MNKEKMLIIILVVSAVLFVCGLFLDNMNNTYRFNFDDGYEPGTTYSGSINLKSGKTILKTRSGCSTAITDDCSDTYKEYSGTLDDEQLKKVKRILGLAEDYDSLDLILAIEYILQGDEFCIEETNKTCLEIGDEWLDLILNGTEV